MLHDSSLNSYSLLGVLVVGGVEQNIGRSQESACQAVEFWSAVDPEHESCVLDNYPRQMWSFPTLDFVSGQLIACDETSCDRFHEGSWKHFVNTRSKRRGHSSAVYEDRILLIGGFDTDQAEQTEWGTEWIPADGSPSQESPLKTAVNQRQALH